MRGNRFTHTRPPRKLGSIPACAGEPRKNVNRSGRRTVYPRVCGGTITHHATRCARRGLSPRVRGNRSAVRPGQETSRSIPACAGEPNRPRCPASPRRVYPRVCGGTGLDPWRRQSSWGLSPRVRGNREGAAGEGRTERSIPACAGEPGVTPWRCGYSRVYPRVCGGT